MTDISATGSPHIPIISFLIDIGEDSLFLLAFSPNFSIVSGGDIKKM